jgi:hypothetical protein
MSVAISEKITNMACKASATCCASLRAGAGDRCRAVLLQVAHKHLVGPQEWRAFDRIIALY